MTFNSTSFMEVLKKTSSKTDQDHGHGTMVLENRQARPETVLRDAGFKIKLVTPTSFGTQVDFAKKYDPAEIEDLLKDFEIKIKGSSVFIVE